jgi:hypothetical protein
VSKHKSVDSLALYKRVKQAKKVEMALKMSDAIGLSVASTSSASTSSASTSAASTTHIFAASTSVASTSVVSAASQRFPFISVDNSDHGHSHFSIDILEEKTQIMKAHNVDIPGGTLFNSTPSDDAPPSDVYAVDDQKYSEISSMCAQHDSRAFKQFAPQLYNCKNISFHFNFHK